MYPAFDVLVLVSAVDWLHKALQRALQMYSLPAVPGSRLAYTRTPEAAIQFFMSYKNARLTGNRDVGAYDCLHTLRVPARQSALLLAIALHQQL